MSSSNLQGVAHAVRGTVVRAAFVSALIGVLTFAGPATAEEMSSDALIEAMKGGGHVIFIRHAQTEKDYADQIDATMGDCSTQRTLSEAGWQEARDIGAAFQAHGIPVGDVVSSQYCRAWQTAELAFGEHVKNADLNFEPAEEYTEEQMKAMHDRVVPHLAKKPAEGVNTVLVGHDDPFDAATGIYPEPMGVTYVIRPLGGAEFEVLGSIAPTAWPQAGG